VDRDHLTEGPERSPADLERRVEELRRINEQLGEELVRGAASRHPRASVAAARTLNRLRQERVDALAQLEEARQRLAEANSGLNHLARENERLRAEVARLRAGLPGFLRRARARLLRR
jgi:chromosome segregation ATPase